MSQPCPECGGTRKKYLTVHYSDHTPDRCPTCNGSGRVTNLPDDPSNGTYPVTDKPHGPLLEVEPSGDDTLTEILLRYGDTQAALAQKAETPKNGLKFAEARTQLLQYIEGEVSRRISELKGDKL